MEFLKGIHCGIVTIGFLQWDLMQPIFLKEGALKGVGWPATSHGFLSALVATYFSQRSAELEVHSDLAKHEETKKMWILAGERKSDLVLVIEWSSDSKLGMMMKKPFTGTEHDYRITIY